MAECKVLRCQNASAGRFVTNDAPRMEAAVCSVHLEQLESGAPWDYNGDGHELVMGTDIPRVLKTFEVSGSIGPGLTLTLEREGDPKPFTVWVSQEYALQLSEFLATESEG